MTIKHIMSAKWVYKWMKDTWFVFTVDGHAVCDCGSFFGEQMARAICAEHNSVVGGS